MWRFGITRTSELSVEALQGAKRRPAYTLVGALAGRASAEDELLLDLLYGYGRLDGGTAWKTTWPHRFAEFDEQLAATITDHFPPGRLVRVHDMGASNAVTSVELFHRLAARRRQLRLRASDLFNKVDVVSLPGSRWRVVFDARGKPIQFVGRRFVLSPGAESRRLLVNRMLAAYLRRTLCLAPNSGWRLAKRSRSVCSIRARSPLPRKTTASCSPPMMCSLRSRPTMMSFAS